MERTQERADTRYWTTYDYFMVEREGRALRRRQLGALTRLYWRKATHRIALALKHAGAQPVRTSSLPASAQRG